MLHDILALVRHSHGIAVEQTGKAGALCDLYSALAWCALLQIPDKISLRERKYRNYRNDDRNDKSHILKNIRHNTEAESLHIMSY